MNQFAKKTTSLFYIYLVLSAPEINAARVKQHYNAARANANAGQDSGLSQELLQDMQEAMQEIEQVKSEYLSASMGQVSYWGESWATCDDRLQDFERRQQKMEKRYDNAMKDGEMSSMEAGRVTLKAFSVASTLSTASKNGCEWVTNKSIDSSSMRNIMKNTMKDHKCLKPATEYLEKARAAGEDPEKAKVKVTQLMLSMDCKVPSELVDETQKSFQQLAKMEEAAEAGAVGEVQEFQKSLDGGKQTSLVETQIFPVLGVLIYIVAAWFFSAVICAVSYGMIATILTMVFLAIKAAFKVALGYTSGVDFKAEMGQIMKPFFTIIATGCSAFVAAYVGILGTVFAAGAATGTMVSAVPGVTLATTASLMTWLGVGGVVGSVAVGGKSLANQAFGEEEEEPPAPEDATPLKEEEEKEDTQ